MIKQGQVVPVHTMTAYGRGAAPLILNLRGSNSATHSKGPGWAPRARTDVLEFRKSLLSLPGIEHRTLLHIA
jgi:hypothetical protein